MTTVTGGSNSIKISSLTGTKTLNDKDLPVKESIQMVMESGDNETGSITLKMNLTYHDPGRSLSFNVFVPVKEEILMELLPPVTVVIWEVTSLTY